MKKAELEKELLELKAKIMALEARPICYGHVCGCNHYNYPQYPGYYPNYPTYTLPVIS
jgi:hypothetical protein